MRERHPHRPPLQPLAVPSLLASVVAHYTRPPFLRHYHAALKLPEPRRSVIRDNTDRVALVRKKTFSALLEGTTASARDTPRAPLPPAPSA